MNQLNTTGEMWRLTIKTPNCVVRLRFGPFAIHSILQFGSEDTVSVFFRRRTVATLVGHRISESVTS